MLKTFYFVDILWKIKKFLPDSKFSSPPRQDNALSSIFLMTAVPVGCSRLKAERRQKTSDTLLLIYPGKTVSHPIRAFRNGDIAPRVKSVIAIRDGQSGRNRNKNGSTTYDANANML